MIIGLSVIQSLVWLESESKYHDPPPLNLTESNLFPIII